MLYTHTSKVTLMNKQKLMTPQFNVEPVLLRTEKYLIALYPNVAIRFFTYKIQDGVIGIDYEKPKFTLRKDIAIKNRKEFKKIAGEILRWVEE